VIFRGQSAKKAGFYPRPNSGPKTENVGMASKGKASNAGKKELLNKRAFQTVEDGSDSENPLSSTSNGTGLMATTDLQENRLFGDANQGNTTEVNGNLGMNGNSNGIHGWEGLVQPTVKTELPASSSREVAEKRIEPTKQRRISQRRPMFKPRDQLKSWRDLGRCDDESADLIAAIDKIKESIEPLTSEYSGAVPVLHSTYAGPSQSPPAIVSQLLATPRAEDNVLINTLPKAFAPRVVEWRQRAPRPVPLSGDGTAQNGFEGARFTLIAGPKPADLAYDLRMAVLGPRQRTISIRDGPLFNRAVRTPLPAMGNYAYTSGQPRALPSSPSSAADNENSRPGDPRTTSNRIGTTPGHPTHALNSALLPLNQAVTQTVPATPIIRPMELNSNQFFPFPTYPEEETTQAHTATPLVPSTIRVANDISSQFVSIAEQTEYEITGYRRDDPSVLWADTMPSAIAPPEERYLASRLLGNGFLSSLSLGAPLTLPKELYMALLEKAERIRLHAEGNIWRAQHAADVIRRHEETIFAKPAQEGDRELKRRHMSKEYHWQPSSRMGHRGGSGGPRGRGNG
jgi:hypothetical protein